MSNNVVIVRAVLTAYAQSLVARWRSADDRERLLQVVQPA